MAQTLKARIRSLLPAALVAGVGMVITKAGLIYTIAMDWSSLSILSSYDPSAQQLLVQSTVDDSFGLVTITQVITASQTQQIKEDAGDVNVATTDGLIAINKTVGAATAVNLPAASSKVGPVQVSDFKGDAGTNNITVNRAGSDVFPGALTTWTIAANGAAAIFTPLSDGTGWAVK
jgi:hypothetical protein